MEPSINFGCNIHVNGRQSKMKKPQVPVSAIIHVRRVDRTSACAMRMWGVMREALFLRNPPERGTQNLR